MNDERTLPYDLLWQDDGHVTDVVLDTMADGEDALVPIVARDHVSACDMCTQRLGDAVLLAMRVGAAIEHVVIAPQPKPWPIPVPALLAAIVVAMLGMIPVLRDLMASITDLASTMLAIVPNLTRAVLALTRAGTGDLASLFALLSLGAVAVLLLGGFAIARAAPRQVHANGGVR